MTRANGVCRGQAQGRLAGALVAVTVGAGAAVMLAGSPAGAAVSRNVTVTFTDDGPSPGSVPLTVNDSVTYVNRLTQGGSVPVAGGLLAQVHSAAVEVHGAPGGFTLPALGSSRTITYTTPGTVAYTATYTLRLVPVLDPLGHNLVPDTVTKSTGGQVAVAAAPSAPAGSDPGTSQPPAQGGAAPSAPPSAPAQAGPAQGAPAVGGAATGQRTGGGTHNQAPGPGAVDRGVPHGAGGPAIDTRPGSRAGAGPGGQSAQGLPPRSDGTASPNPMTGIAGRKAALGLPAVIAVILLCVVSTALVRTMRRYVPAGRPVQ